MIRKFVSLTVFFSFVILFASSFALYFIPGAQTGAAGWSFLALSRHQWTDVHISSGILFLAFGLWHTVLNWKGIVAGFRKAASIHLKSAWPLTAALILNFFILAGTLGHIQPVETVLSYYQQVKKEFRQGGSFKAGRGASEAGAANTQAEISPARPSGESIVISEFEGGGPTRP